MGQVDPPEAALAQPPDDPVAADRARIAQRHSSAARLRTMAGPWFPTSSCRFPSGWSDALTSITAPPIRPEMLGTTTGFIRIRRRPRFVSDTSSTRRTKGVGRSASDTSRRGEVDGARKTGSHGSVEQVCNTAETSASRDRLAALRDVPLGDRAQPARGGRQVGDPPGVDPHQPAHSGVDGRQVRSHDQHARRRGVPMIGPSPSMPMMPSTIARCGRTAALMSRIDGPIPA